MKAKWLPLSAVVALVLSSAAASAVDFHGYARAGMQANSQGGEVYCIGKGASGHKVGRLGDECDTYAEIALSQELYNKNNSKFTINTLVAYGTTEDTQDLQGNTWQGVGGSGPWGGQRMSIRELWAGYQTDLGYQIWAGKRYYQRKDIHLWDMYYLNDSGYGAGIENISVGNLGNLNFAVIKGSTGDKSVKYEDKYYIDDEEVTGKDYSVNYNRNFYKLDARWNAIPVGFGKLDVAVIYGLPAISDKQREDVSAQIKNEKEEDHTKVDDNTVSNSGVLITLDHALDVTTDNISLMNHFIVQYGTNGFSNAGTFGNHTGGDYTPDIDAQGVRVIDWGTFDAGNFGLGYAMLWGHINSGEDHGSTGAWNPKRSGWEYAITLRPEYKWTDFTRTTLELGYSQMKTNDNVATTRAADSYKDPLTHISPIVSQDKDPDLYKITLAQQFTPGKGFWARPAIRFYVSYLGGDQFAHDYKLKNKDGHNYQVTFGTQMEAWW